MVLMDIFLESLSRCLNLPDASGNSSFPMTGAHAQPLGASNSQYDRNDGGAHNDNDCENEDHSNSPDDGNNNTQNNCNGDGDLDGDDVQLNSPRSCYDSPPPKRNEAQVLADARREISTQSSKRRPPEYYSPTPSSFRKQQASLEKTRSICSQKKLDIFRPRTRKAPSSSSSFASRLLGGEGSFPSGAMLCFANPILDEEDQDDELKLQRMDETLSGDDVETVTSTLYFDSKYEHVVQHQAPVPLYSEFQLKNEDDIQNIFQSGSHKMITSICCPSSNPSSLPIQQQRKQDSSMVDKTLDEDSSSENSYCSKGEEYPEDESSSNEQVTTRPGHQSQSITYAMGDSSPMQQRRSIENLGVIEETEAKDHSAIDTFGSGLKIRSKSSLSTAALTPVCSSRSNVSMSPQQQRHICSDVSDDI